MNATVAAIILAGGNGSRLGGRSKADLLLGQITFLDQIITDLHAAGVKDTSIVVAGPPRLSAATTLRSRVRYVLEDPPGTGPAAGLVTALKTLNASTQSAGTAPTHPQSVFVTTCDAPHSGKVLPLLVKADEEVAAASADLISVVDEDGQPQHLLSLYRWAPLWAAARGVDPSNLSVRRLVGNLSYASVSVSGGLTRDVDTWVDYRQISQC